MTIDIKILVVLEDRMRNLVLILIAFIAVVTFIRAFDNSANEISPRISEAMEFENRN
jgi:hypothetical protein